MKNKNLLIFFYKFKIFVIFLLQIVNQNTRIYLKNVGDNMDYVEMFIKLSEDNDFSIRKCILLFLFSACIMLAKLEIDNENIRIKTSILYVIFYLLILFKSFSVKYILIIFLIITFIFLEFVFSDSFKRKIIKNPFYFVLDYIYQIIFEYKVLYFFISLFLISDWLKNITKVFLILIKIYPKINNLYPLYSIIIYFLSILILGIGIIKMLNNEFKTLNFEEIKNKIEKIMPFAGFGTNAKLCDFANILSYKEDRSFFKRKNSYNWISLSFIFYRLKRMYINSTKYFAFENNSIGKIYNIIVTILYYIFKFIEFIYNIIKKTILITYNVIIKHKNIRRYMRGYSTIEMQLIRTIALEDGYINHIIQRKAYEIIYSKLFFSSLKKFYMYHRYSNTDDYKYYLIYLYIRVAPIKMNNIRYKNILDLYKKKTVNDITEEEFFIWTYGLSFSPINYDILKSKNIKMFNINKEKLKKLIEKFETKED